MTRAPSESLATTKRLLVLARDLLKAPDLKSVLDLIGPAFQELLGADGVLLLLRLVDQEYVTAFDPRGFLQPDDSDGTLYRQGRQALESQMPVLLPDLVTDPGSPSGDLPCTGTACLLAVPFPPVRPLGVLAAFWCQNGGQQKLDKRMPIVRSIGELIEAAMGDVGSRLTLEAQVSVCTQQVVEAAQEHAKELRRRDRLEEEIRRISMTDPLTGMLNRRGFFLHAQRSLKVARRGKLPSALIFADIDGLKAVNDGLGHGAGDRLIQDSAWIMRNSFRDSDVVARFGGDEFAAFTLDSEQPAAILARIQENIETFHQHSPRLYRVSFSTGIVPCDPSSDLTLSAYLALADKAMYVQKRSK